MKSSTLKQVGLGIGILLIGAIGGYLLANHQIQNRGFFDGRPRMNGFMHGGIDSMFKDFDKEFEDMDKQFENERKKMRKNWEDFDKEFNSLELSGDYDSKGSFSYYEKKNVNGEESSYDVNGNWKHGEYTGDLIINGTNLSGKEFSYTGSIVDGQSKGVIIDEDGNSKNLNLNNIDINEVYNISNHMTDE